MLVQQFVETLFCFKCFVMQNRDSCFICHWQHFHTACHSFQVNLSFTEPVWFGCDERMSSIAEQNRLTCETDVSTIYASNNFFSSFFDLSSFRSEWLFHVWSEILHFAKAKTDSRLVGYWLSHCLHACCTNENISIKQKNDVRFDRLEEFLSSHLMQLSSNLMLFNKSSIGGTFFAFPIYPFTIQITSILY